ncbi:MAG: hypothetical protein MUE85_10390 [Microscillaceae bacterium]|jgi:hypothetical protein|nr:hypothetical protein [Microscillaceae bacterium]
MQKALFILTVLITLLSACSASKKISTNSSTSTDIVENDASRDGSSAEKAIVVKSIEAEYAWIRKNYPNSRMRSQALVFVKKKPYDILKITTAEGEEKSIYFDISKFFGKF